MVWDMFLREVKRQNRNGTQVSYLQLVHNEWDAAVRTSRTKILYSFGRTDQVDTAAIERLIVSLSRLYLLSTSTEAVPTAYRPRPTVPQRRPDQAPDHSRCGRLRYAWRRYASGAL